jgi:hypothetical protein
MSRSQKIEKPRRDKKYQTLKFILSSAIFVRSAVRKGEGALKNTIIARQREIYEFIRTSI